MATRPSPNIAQKVQRQPQVLPIAVPIGHADDAGHRQPGKDERDGHAALVFAHQPDGDHHGDAEIGAVRHRDGDAEEQHRQ